MPWARNSPIHHRPRWPATLSLVTTPGSNRYYGSGPTTTLALQKAARGLALPDCRAGKRRRCGGCAFRPYLHDGRADTVEEAIAFHGGEAVDSVERYVALSTESRNRLLAFLATLAAPIRRVCRSSKRPTIMHRRGQASQEPAWQRNSLAQLPCSCARQIRSRPSGAPRHDDLSRRQSTPFFAGSFRQLKVRETCKDPGNVPRRRQPPARQIGEAAQSARSRSPKSPRYHDGSAKPVEGWPRRRQSPNR